MHFKNLLSEQSFPSQPEKEYLEDSYNAFLISDKSALEKSGFKLVEEHDKDGLKIEDFEDEEKNEIRVVNTHFITFKKHKGHIFNWSCELKEVIKNIIQKEDTPISVRYYFNFPVGRFSDKGIVDLLEAKNIKHSSILDNDIQNNEFFKEQFFNINKDLDEVIKTVCEPMNDNFSALDLLNIGYLKSSRENSYFIEDNNYYFQNSELPNIIYMDENNHPIAKKFEKNEPVGHLILVNMKENTIEHKINKIKDSKDYAIFITYKDNQMEIEKKEALLMLKPKQKQIRKMLPLMGYPNGYSFDEENFQWFVGKDPEDMTDITNDVRILLENKNPEMLNDVERAYFNFIFKIGNENDIFEEILESVGNPAFSMLDPEQFLFIEPCLEGEHIYKEAYDTFKNVIQEQIKEESV